MIKKSLMAAAVALSAVVYFNVSGQTADAPSAKEAKDTKSSGQKAVQQKTEKAAPNRHSERRQSV